MSNEKKEVELRRFDVYGARKALEAISNIPGRMAVLYARNIAILDELIKGFEEYKKKSPDFQEYQRKQKDLIREYAEKDEEGNVVKYDQSGEVDPNGDIMKPDGSEEYQAALESLKDRYKGAIEEYQNTLDSFRNEFLEERISFEVFVEGFSEFPKEVREEPSVMKHLAIFVDKGSLSLGELTGKELQSFPELFNGS